MQLKSTKAEQDARGTKYVDVILTEMDIVVLHSDLAKAIEDADRLGTKDQDRDAKRKIIFGKIDDAFNMLRPS
jgi:hypothetical protein